MIKENIVASGHGSIYPKYLVVHSTANVGATAKNHLAYWKNGAKYYAHYVSDWNAAYHAVKDDRKCYHVGNANSFTIGIEICESSKSSERKAGIEIAAEACSEILKKHGWDTSKLITHDDCRRRWGGTDHTDPLPYFKRCGISWSEFKSKVDGYLKPKPKPLPMPKQPATKPVNDAGCYYRAHVQRAGWLSPVHDGMTAGTEGYSARMEAIKLSPPKGVKCDVSVHLQSRGWVDYKGVQKGVYDPVIGTTGEARRIEALRIHVTENPGNLKILYRVHVQKQGWTDWKSDGETAGTTGKALRAEAVQIKFI